MASRSEEIKTVLVRLDLWPTWLEIGCRATEQAIVAAQQLRSELPDEAKAALVTAELQGGLVAVTAFAFSFDGFYDTIRNELGRHPHEPAWKKNGTARWAQVSDTLRYHLKLGPKFSALLRQNLKELFEFRSLGRFRPAADGTVIREEMTMDGSSSLGSAAAHRHCRAREDCARSLCARPARLVLWAERAVLGARRDDALPLVASEGLPDGFADES